MAEVKTDFIPLLPLNNGVVLPNMVVTIPLEREEAQAAIGFAKAKATPQEESFKGCPAGGDGTDPIGRAGETPAAIWCRAN